MQHGNGLMRPEENRHEHIRAVQQSIVIDGSSGKAMDILVQYRGDGCVTWSEGREA